MIYYTDQDAEGPYQSMPISYPQIPGLDKPSYPHKIQSLLPSLIREFHVKTNQLMNKYPWLVDSSTIINTTIKTTTFTNASLGEVIFDSFHLGTFNPTKGIWTWAWANLDYENLNEYPSMALRDYGFRTKIEALTKPIWQASQDEKIEILALSFKLKFGVGIELKQIDGLEFFYLLMEK